MAEIGIPLNHSFRIQLSLAALYLVGFVRESKLLQTNYHGSHNHSKGDYGNTSTKH